jgi:predicted GIY-YIG superfamily endonuclease
MPVVYLIHFENKLSHAQHYLGYTTDLDNRLITHRCGHGSKLLAAVTRQNIDWQLVRTWNGDRALERKLKRRKNSRQLCPICNPDHWMDNAKE